MNQPVPKKSFVDWLNHECFCMSLDRTALNNAMAQEVDDPAFLEKLIADRTHLFSNVPLFMARRDLEIMLTTVQAIEAAAALPAFREAVLAQAKDIAREDHGPLGVFMGYDFHLGVNGPKLIEINTNAGGGVLNAFLAKAQRACCKGVDDMFRLSTIEHFDAAVVAMFQNEWMRQRGQGAPKVIAIVDEAPENQYLYPEFLLMQRLLDAHGFTALITDPGALTFDGTHLNVGDVPIDLVYNRLVDFALERPESQALRAAYAANAVVLTPNPHNHACLADKRNLILLSQPEMLKTWGVKDNACAALAHVPRTLEVTAAVADELWAQRKGFFFKPTSGHGGKAVYRGDKITKRVWDEILEGGYIAQELVAPSTRSIKIADGTEVLKADVRLYTYKGELLLAAARIYQGQTTNFRTPGGGFAPVFFF